MLARRISLHDIDDVEAFVIACVKRSGVGVSEDTVADGMMLLYAMAKNYKHQMDGYDKPGRFSGYAIKFLPRQIAREWHRQQEHHLYRKQPDGTRKWEVMQPPISYESATAENTQEGQKRRVEHTMRTIQQWVNVPRMTK